MSKNVAQIMILLMGLLIVPVLVSTSYAKDGLKGDFTAGVGLVDLEGKSSKHGEYDGLDDDSFYLIGNAQLSYVKSLYYLDVNAETLGLENRGVYLETGNLGDYKLSFDYSESIFLISGTGETPYNGTGGDNLVLPAGYGQYSTTASMPFVSLKKVDLELKRTSGKVSYKKKIKQNVEVGLSFKREKKEGISSIGAAVGQNGIFASSVILPQPVDFNTDEVRAYLSFNKEKYQASFEYFLSQFENDNSDLKWENPFLGSTKGRLSLPPGNRHQKISFSGGMDLAKQTRVTINAETGTMEQNENFIPYSVNNEIPANRSANAKIQTSHLSIKASSKPLPKLLLAASYRFHERDNKTSRKDYLLVMNDSGPQASTGSKNNIYNLPADYVENKVTLDASYKINKALSLKVGYDNELIERGYRSVKKTKEDKYRANLKIRGSESLSGSIHYSYSARRSEDSYDESNVYNSYYTSAYRSSVHPSLRHSNHTDLRQYDIADRDETRYGANLMISGPLNSFFGINYNSGSEDYDKSVIGLKKRVNDNYTFDITASPLKDLSCYGFYSKEEMKTDIASTSSSSGRWDLKSKDMNDTIGIGISAGFLRNVITIDADYSYAVSKSSTGFSVANSADLPDLKSKRDNFKLTGRYKVNKKMTLSLGYEYEKYSSDDWATENTAPGGLSSLNSNILTLGSSESDYEAHIGRFFITYKL